MFDLRSVFSSILVPLFVSGCMAAYVPAPLPLTHPANPTAPEVPPSPSSHAFMSEHLSPTPREEMPAQGPHAGHSAMSGGMSHPPATAEEAPAQSPHVGHSAMPGGHQ